MTVHKHLIAMYIHCMQAYVIIVYFLITHKLIRVLRSERLDFHD